MMPAPHTAMAVPRCRSGKISHMIACAIGMTGPPPSPWATRMATRNSRFGAIPERNELTVKSPGQIRKNRRRPKRAESQPVAGMTIALAARKDVMTQDISSMPADSEPCMWGRATLVTLVSRTCMTVTIITESVMAHLRAGDTCASVIPRGILRRRQSSPPPPTDPHPVPAGFPAVPSWPPCCVSHQMRHSNEPSVHKEADHATSDEAPDLCPSGGHSLEVGADPADAGAARRPPGLVEVPRPSRFSESPSAHFDLRAQLLTPRQPDMSKLQVDVPDRPLARREDSDIRGVSCGTSLEHT